MDSCCASLIGWGSTELNDCKRLPKRGLWGLPEASSVSVRLSSTEPGPADSTLHPGS